MLKVTYITSVGDTLNCNVVVSGIDCPNCHKHIVPTPLCVKGTSSTKGHMMVQCTDLETCKACFIINNCTISGNSTRYTCYMDYEVFKGTLVARAFNPSITELSPNFVEIYNQAFIAEQQNLSQICGVGYRKALEFLVKDFCIKYNPDDEENIKVAKLAYCIETYVGSEKIEQVAKRAVWLGNDETHYVRTWVNKDLSDLKSLIDLTIYWAEMEELTRRLEIDMPKPEKIKKK